LKRILPIKKGDFDNSCLKTLSDCELLSDIADVKPKVKGHYINYTPIRNFLVGFSYYLTTGDTKGDFYQWSCIWQRCWDNEKRPSAEEFSAGRFFSPIFGSLTILFLLVKFFSIELQDCSFLLFCYSLVCGWCTAD